jgi:hypothetical protein
LYKEKEEPVFVVPIFSDGTFEIRGMEERDYRVALKLSGIPVEEGGKDKEPQPGPMPPPMPLPMPPGGPQGSPPGPPGRPPHGPGGPILPKMPLPAITPELKAKYDRIDRKYEDPAKSGLHLTVGPSPKHLDPWKLDGAPAPEKNKP